MDQNRLFRSRFLVLAGGLESGGWDAIHVVEVRPNGKRAAYKLTSTIMLRLATDHSTSPKASGELKLSGSMTRQQEQEFAAADDHAHLPNMGRMIEEMENRMRDSLQASQPPSDLEGPLPPPSPTAHP